MKIEGTVKTNEDGKVIRIEEGRVIIRTDNKIKRTMWCQSEPSKLRIADGSAPPLTTGHLDLKVMF